VMLPSGVTTEISEKERWKGYSEIHAETILKDLKKRRSECLKGGGRIYHFEGLNYREGIGQNCQSPWWWGKAAKKNCAGQIIGKLVPDLRTGRRTLGHPVFTVRGRTRTGRKD